MVSENLAEKTKTVLIISCTIPYPTRSLDIAVTETRTRNLQPSAPPATPTLCLHRYWVESDNIMNYKNQVTPLPEYRPLTQRWISNNKMDIRVTGVEISTRQEYLPPLFQMSLKALGQYVLIKASGHYFLI